MSLLTKIYILFSVALLLFEVGFLAIKHRNHKQFVRQNTRFANELRDEIALRRKTNAFSLKFSRKLPHLLMKTKHLVALQTELENDSEVADWFRVAVFSQIDTYCKKPDCEQAFYAYVLSCFDYTKTPIPPEIANRLLALLDSTSVYTFSNTMQVFYRSGEVRWLLMAIDKADERGKFYHRKLLTDGILSAKVDQIELTREVEQRFYQYTPHTQLCLLDVFRMGQGDATALCLRVLNDTTLDEEVRYCAMRYFGKYPSMASREIFLRILSEESAEWVAQMLAIQGLRHYHDAETRRAIQQKVTSCHWYVRKNAVEYLHEQALNPKEIVEILQMQDQYASEALLYQYRDDHEMTQFIIGTIQAVAKTVDNMEGEGVA